MICRPTIRDLATISLAADRAAILTRQLLTFSRRQVMQPQVLDVNEIIRNTARSLERTLGDRITVRFDFASNVPPVYADAGMLEQIIVNLAHNARDAMPQGGLLLIGSTAMEVTPAYTRQNPEARVGQFVRLTVEDTGVGMDAQVLNRLFEPFFTTKEVGKGTGLGLATVYGITKLHKGWIEATSVVNQGSAFHVFLPMTSKPAEAPSGGPVEKEIRGAMQRCAGRRRLELLALARQILSATVIAFRGWHRRRALKLCRRFARDRSAAHRYGHARGHYGWELATKLRAERPDLKVICASGYSMIWAKNFTRREISFLQKPFNHKCWLLPCGNADVSRRRWPRPAARRGSRDFSARFSPRRKYKTGVIAVTLLLPCTPRVSNVTLLRHTSVIMEQTLGLRPNAIDKHSRLPLHSWLQACNLRHIRKGVHSLCNQRITNAGNAKRGVHLVLLHPI
jgi:hypothetical protein